MNHNDPQDIDQNFEELELVAEKAGELNDRVGRIENEIGTQAKALESAAMVLNAAVKGLGALRHETLESDIGTLQLSINEKTEHLAREIARFEAAVAEIDRRSEAGDEQLNAALRDIALGLRSSFDAKSAEVAEWSTRVEREIAAHSVALAAIPPVLKGADAKQLNPRGEWEAGMIVNALDVVSYNGSSYISNVDGNTDKPSRSDKYTVLAKRSGNGAGGATDFGSLTGTIASSQLVPGSTTYAVGDVLYAGTTGALSKLGAGSSGQLLSTQGAGAAPIWVTATGGAGDMNGPASATDNAVARFDGTGGKTVQNSTVTISDTGDITAAGKLFTADGTNAAPAIAITSSTGTGLYLDAANTLGVATGGNGTVTFSTASGVANITGHGVRSLTLTGGSSGASLVLGQGSNGGTFTNGAVAKQMGWNSTAANGSYHEFLTSGVTFGYLGTAASMGMSGATNFGIRAINDIRFGAGANLSNAFTSTGNLLIGTTTDISGSGGLRVAGNSATGAGATLKTWNATYGAAQVGPIGAFISGSNGATIFGSNRYVTSGGVDSFITTGYANDLTFFGGAATLRGSTASGSADGAITWQNALVTVAGTGAVQFPSVATATNTTSGAVQIGSNIGLSGNAGGASYFGGAINLPATGTTFGLVPTSGTSAGSLTITSGAVIANGGAGGDLNLKAGNSFTGAADAGGSVNIYAGGNNYSSAGTMGSINFYGGAVSAGTVLRASIGATGVFNITNTTPASSSTTGALTIGNGTAATNVAIGGGNVNAGGTLTVGGTVIHTLSATPASAAAAGTVGTMSWDGNYIYICTAANTWKRVAIATW